MDDQDGRHLGQGKQARRLVAGVPGDDGAFMVDDDRVGEAEVADRCGDLLDLPRVVPARVARRRLEQADRAQLDPQGIDDVAVGMKVTRATGVSLADQGAPSLGKGGGVPPSKAASSAAASGTRSAARCCSSATAAPRDMSSRPCAVWRALSDQHGRRREGLIAKADAPSFACPALYPFRRFNSSPEVIRLVVMMYVRFPLSLRNVEDLLAERGIDVCHETVRFWWNRFGPLFAGDIRRSRVSAMRAPATGGGTSTRCT